MAPPSLTEPSRVAIEAAFEAAVNALAVSPTVDEPRPSQLAYLGIQLLRRAGTRGRQAAEELLAEHDAAEDRAMNSAPATADDPALAALASRPTRTGKYFVVHREILDESPVADRGVDELGEIPLPLRRPSFLGSHGRVQAPDLRDLFPE